ncbi:MAG: transglycosylase domain-containing protein [Fibrobacterota bacterium]
MGKFFRPLLIAVLVAGLAVLCVAGYFGLERVLEWYVLRSARTLVDQEQRGQLSREYGYVWSEINLAREMQKKNRAIVRTVDTAALPATVPAVVPLPVNRTMPSLAAVRELNQILQVSNYIRITDRYGYLLAEIKTTHTRLRLDEINPVLLKAILGSEDRNFYGRALAYEYRGFVRALLRALPRAFRTFSLPRPRGTSTLHQQVAKFLLARFDVRGYVYTERTVSRKIQEIKLAQALKMTYTSEELLQVYLNHCVSAGYGMTGYNDISQGLFGKKQAELDICQSLYLARLVKWNRNVPQKIFAQIRADMPRIGATLGWDARTRDSILTALPRLRFNRPQQIVSEHAPLVDLANETWLALCRQNGMPGEEIAAMDFSQPHSIIRRKGNLTIRLAIDLRLQRQLETLVNRRGFGRDTLLRTDVRIGSAGSFVPANTQVRDTLRKIQALKADSLFSEAGGRLSVRLHKGDTLVTNVRYRRLADGSLRRSLYFYCRDTMRVAGQYYSYALMNSRTGELLAYYSRDGIGSRLSSLLRNRTPNGSSTAKPLLYALNYDLGHFPATYMTTDSAEVAPPAAWARKFLTEGHRNVGMIYLNTSAPGGYPVSNHGKVFEGFDYLFNHLTESNNILCVEMIYRLNGPLYGPDGAVLASGQPLFGLLTRLGDTTLIGPGQTTPFVTGTQIYARIAARTGVRSDTINDLRGRIPLPPDYYSVALGTLELSLYQQMHLFNVLYNNEIIADPEKHPSLVIRGAAIAGDRVPLSDTVVRSTLFSDLENVRPALLGLHKRLVSNAADGLERYDVVLDSGATGPLSNFAKSGTSDDILRPYDRDVVTRERTNYGLWNAVLRLRLPVSGYQGLPREPLPLPGDNALLDTVPESELLDVTLACIGECHERNTGARDGKTLHKYVSSGLLRAWGVPVDTGFFRQYEARLVRNTPDSIRFANPSEPLALDSARIAEIRQTVGDGEPADTIRIKQGIFFGVYLPPESYRRLLGWGLYMGKEAGRYDRLVEELNSSRKADEMAPIIVRMRELPVANPVFRAAYADAMKNLMVSLARAAR